MMTPLESLMYITAAGARVDVSFVKFSVNVTVPGPAYCFASDLINVYPYPCATSVTSTNATVCVTNETNTTV